MKKIGFLLLCAAFLIGGLLVAPKSQQGRGRPPKPVKTPRATPTPIMALQANAGSDFSAYVGEPVHLDGSASTEYITVSQTDGTWSIKWDTGDGYDAQNIIKAPHVYMEAGTYTATLTIKSAGGASSTDTATITVTDIPTATGPNTQTLTDTANAATNKTNLQNAINTAAANANTNRIIIPAGFIANGSITIPSRSATTYVTIEVENASTNLPVNERATISDISNMFKIVANDPGTMGVHYAVRLTRDSQYYRFIGMHVERQEGTVNILADLFGVDLSEGTGQSEHIILDRCVLNGNDKKVGRGLSPNGRSWSLLNSSVLDIKSVGIETKAIGQYDGEGPLGVINNRLDAASINTIIGGVDVAADESVLKGFVFRGNYSWKDPDWNGVYGVKNQWELKYGHDTVCVGNIFENNYADGQQGEAILLKSATQGDDPAPYNEVRNLDFRNNKILNTRAGFNVVNMQGLSEAPYPAYANHIRFFNNFWEHQQGRGNLANAPNYFEVNHNTFIYNDTPPSQFIVMTHGGEGVPSDYEGVGYRVLNNITFETEFNWAFSGDGVNGSIALAEFFASPDVQNNVFPGVNSGLNPASNYYPSTASFNDNFTNYAGGDYSLAGGSAYNNAATDGTDIGANMTELNSAVNSATTGIWIVSGDGEAAPVFYRLVL